MLLVHPDPWRNIKALNQPRMADQSLRPAWVLVRGGHSGEEAPCTCRKCKERPVAMVTGGQPRLPAACEEKAPGRLGVRRRSPPGASTQPARGVTTSGSTWAVSTAVQEEEGAGLALSILREGGWQEPFRGVCVCACVLVCM